MSARFTLARTLLGFGLVVSSLTLAAGVEPEKANKANYANAFKYSREFVQQFSYDTSVTPNWINKSDNFWYVYRTSKGTNYWKVTPANKSKEPLFDHAKLAAALSELSKKPIEANGLALSRVTLSDDGVKLKFTFDEYLYECEIAANKLTKGGKAPRGFQPPAGGAGLSQDQQQRRQEQIDRLRQQQEQQQQNQNQNQNQNQQQQQQQQDQQQQNQNQQQNQGQAQEATRTSPFDYKNTSPDKKFYVYCYKHNIYLAEPDKEKEAIQLSKDGEEDYSFSGGGFGQSGFGGGGRGGNTDTRPVDPERKTRVNATWSTDSKSCFVTRRDARGVQELFLVDSIAAPRPKLEKYKYPMPGEEKTRKSELFYVNVESKKLVQVKPHWKDESYFNTHWGKTSNELRFVRRDRLQRNIEFCALDVKTGACKCVLEEGIENGNIEFQNARYLEDTDEMIWWSERSGWGHFYLYERSGKLKNTITSGAYRASSIVAVDSKNRTLYFHGNAREPGENVYYQHLYSVRLDGTGLTLLDPGNANHTSTLSSGYQMLVDNTSRVDAVPTSTLRDSAGNKIMDLETCDLSRLMATDWKLPSTFSVKAADGVTDLYGNMWVPFDMDPKKQYPIIANVYPGPQTEGVTHTFAAYSSTMQLAQLGFIVIQVGHRGGTPTRSKAYHRYGYNNLRDYALEDTKYAIEQLALEHRFIDINRVGIYGHSGGGFMSAAALLQKPYNDFFKAAVASAGNHDNNIYNDNWSERYHGMKEVPADQADTKTQIAGSTQATTATQGAQGGQGGQNGQRRRRPPEEGEDYIEIDYDRDNEPQATKEQQDNKAVIEAITKELASISTKMATAKGDDLAKLEKDLNDAKGRLDKLSIEMKKETVKKDDKTEVKKDTDKKTDITKTDDKTKVETKKEESKTETKKEEEKKEEEKKMKFSIAVPTNAELAANLKGSLLLVHGEIDNNVHPANTMRLVDALIKANKRFDMLILPGQRHGFGTSQPYFNQRMWDFFADHLLGDRQDNADILEKKMVK